jgi:hypothetical protein
VPAGTVTVATPSPKSLRRTTGSLKENTGTGRGFLVSTLNRTNSTSFLTSGSSSEAFAKSAQIHASNSLRTTQISFALARR